MPRVKKENRVETLSLRDIKKLRNEIKDLRDKCAILLGFETAARVGEMSFFSVAGIDWSHKTINKHDVKKKEWRAIGISDELLDDLKTLIETTKLKDKLFVSEISGKPLKWTGFNNLLRFWCADKLGYNPPEVWVSWHLLRRAFVSLAKEMGYTFEEVSYITGDRPSTIAKYYDKVSPSDMGRKASRFYEAEEG